MGDKDILELHLVTIIVHQVRLHQQVLLSMRMHCHVVCRAVYVYLCSISHASV